MLDADDDASHRGMPFLKTVRPDSAALTRDNYDPELTNCSLDTVPDPEASTSQNGPKASTALTSASLDPVLTICNLPPGLITSNTDLVQKTVPTIPQQKAALQGSVPDLKMEALEPGPQLLAKKKIQDYPQVVKIVPQVHPSFSNSDNSHDETRNSNTEEEKKRTTTLNREILQTQPSFFIDNKLVSRTELETTEVPQQHSQLVNKERPYNGSHILETAAKFLQEDNRQKRSQSLDVGVSQNQTPFLTDNKILHSAQLLTTEVSQHCSQIVNDVEECSYSETRILKKTAYRCCPKYYIKNKLLSRMGHTCGLARRTQNMNDRNPVIKYLSKNKILKRMQLTYPDVSDEFLNERNVHDNPNILKAEIVPLAGTNANVLTEESSYNAPHFLNAQVIPIATKILTQESSHKTAHVFNAEVIPIAAKMLTNESSHNNQYVLNEGGVPIATKMMTGEISHNTSHIINAEVIPMATKVMTEESAQNNLDIMNTDGIPIAVKILTQGSSHTTAQVFNAEVVPVSEKILTEESSHINPYVVNSEGIPIATKTMTGDISHNAPHILNAEVIPIATKVMIEKSSHNTPHILNAEVIPIATKVMTEESTRNNPHIVNTEGIPITVKILTQESSQDTTHIFKAEVIPNTEKMLIGESSHNNPYVLKAQDIPIAVKMLTEESAHNNPHIVNTEGIPIPINILTQESSHNTSHIFNAEVLPIAEKMLTEQSSHNNPYVLNGESIPIATTILTENNAHNNPHIVKTDGISGAAKILSEPDTHNNLQVVNTEGNPNAEKIVTEEDGHNITNILNSEVIAIGTKIITEESSNNTSNIVNAEVFPIAAKMLNEENLQNRSHKVESAASQNHSDSEFLIANKLLSHSHHLNSDDSQSCPQLMHEMGLHVSTCSSNVKASEGKLTFVNEESQHNETRVLDPVASQIVPQLLITDKSLIPTHSTSKVPQSCSKLLNEVSMPDDIRNLEKDCSPSTSNFLNENILQNPIPLLGTEDSRKCPILLNEKSVHKDVLNTQISYRETRITDEDHSQNDNKEINPKKVMGRRRPQGLIKNKLLSRIKILNTEIIHPSQFMAGKSVQNIAHVLEKEISKPPRSDTPVLYRERRSSQHAIKKKKYRRSHHQKTVVSHSHPQVLLSSNTKTSQNGEPDMNKKVSDKDKHALKPKIPQRNTQQRISNNDPLTLNINGSQESNQSLKNSSLGTEVHIVHKEVSQRHTQFLNEESIQKDVDLNKEVLKCDAQISNKETSQNIKLKPDIGLLQHSAQYASEKKILDNMHIHVGAVQKNAQTLEEDNLQNTKHILTTEKAVSDKVLSNNHNLQYATDAFNKEHSQYFSQFLNEENSLNDIDGLNTKASQSGIEYLTDDHSKNDNKLFNKKVLQFETRFFPKEHLQAKSKLLNRRALRRGLRFLNEDNSQNAAHLMDTDTSTDIMPFIHDDNSQNATHPLDIAVKSERKFFKTATLQSQTVPVNVDVQKRDTEVLNKNAKDIITGLLRTKYVKEDLPNLNDDKSRHYMELTNANDSRRETEYIHKKYKCKQMDSRALKTKPLKHEPQRAVEVDARRFKELTITKASKRDTEPLNKKPKDNVSQFLKTKTSKRNLSDSDESINFLDLIDKNALKRDTAFLNRKSKQKAIWLMKQEALERDLVNSDEDELQPDMKFENAEEIPVAVNLTTVSGETVPDYSGLQDFTFQPGSSAPQPQPSTSKAAQHSETTEKTSEITFADTLTHKRKNQGPGANNPTTSTDLDCHFFRSSRGRRMLMVGETKYRVNSVCADKVRWRCASHERFGCRARIHTVENKIVYFVNEHITSSPNTGIDDIEPVGVVKGTPPPDK